MRKAPNLVPQLNPHYVSIIEAKVLPVKVSCRNEYVTPAAQAETAFRMGTDTVQLIGLGLFNLDHAERSNGATVVSVVDMDHANGADS